MSPLIEPVDLAALLSRRPPPVVLDVRWRLGGPPARPDHDAAHIPGAVFVDLGADLAAPPGPAGRHPLPEPAALQTVLRRAGVSHDSVVVAHDDGNGSIAARAWWLLRWAGLPAAQVHVLDGGWAAWTAAGLPTTAEPTSPTPGDVEVRPGGMPVLDAEGAAALAVSGVLLDARAAPRYRGETEPVDPRAGHVPGAVNLPFAELVDAGGRFRPPAAVAAVLTAAGVRATGGRPHPDGGPVATVGSVEDLVGAYCGSGVTATLLVLAAEYADIRPPERPIALYAGSWSQWSADPARPVATGPARLPVGEGSR